MNMAIAAVERTVLRKTICKISTSGPRGGETPLGAAGCAFLISGLPAPTWLRLIIWMAIGLVIYFTYAHRHARYSEANAPAE